MRSGVPIVVSAPSGGGKTSLCRRVIADLGQAVFSVSHTTRPRRGTEREGVDYHYVEDKRFDELIAENAFLEHANVHGKRYGTTREHVIEKLTAGTDVFFDVDVQGGRQISERLPGTALVFILPPNMRVLEQRLRQRATDVDDQIAKRLAAVQSEIDSAHFYSYWIVNDDFEHAVRELSAIVTAERIRHADKQHLSRALFGER